MVRKRPSELEERGGKKSNGMRIVVEEVGRASRENKKKQD